MVKITRDMSVLFIGVIPIPITTDFSIVNKSNNEDYRFDYEKYDKTNYNKDGSSPTTQGVITEANHFEDLSGAASVSLEFMITYTKETQKVISLLKPLALSVIQYAPSLNSVQKVLKAEENSYLKKSLTRVSYYDADGFSTFFQYKLSNISLNHDKNGNVAYLSITATLDTSVVEEKPEDTGFPDNPPINVIPK